METTRAPPIKKQKPHCTKQNNPKNKAYFNTDCSNTSKIKRARKDAEHSPRSSMERRVVFVSNALQSAATLESPLPQIPEDKEDQVGNHAKKILKINIGPRAINNN
jgi:hypothetical protein